MSTYMNKVVGNLVQTRTGFTTKERTTARQNIDLNASLFTSSDNSLNFEDLDNDTKQINVTSDAYSLTSNAGINIVPNDTDKTIAINHATTTAADAAIVRVGKDAYGHVVLGTAITAADFKAVTYTDAKKTTDSDKYIYLLNGVATEGRTVLDVNSTNSGLTLEDSKFIKINCGTNLAIGTDGKLNNTYTYTLPEATSTNLGGIKIGYKATTDKNYAVLLNEDNQAYVSVPWEDTHCTTSMFVTTKDGTSDQIIVANTNKVYLALYDDKTLRSQHKIYGDGTIIKISSEAETGAGAAIKIDGSHNHGLLSQNGTLGQQIDFPGTSISSYLTDNPSAKIEIPLAMTYMDTDKSWSTEYELTRSSIELSATGTKFLKEDGSWADPNTHIYFGIKNASANSKQENGNVYMTLTDESTVRHSYNITGSGGTTVTSDANGNITINSVNMDALSITRESAAIPSTGTVNSIAFKTTVVDEKTQLADDTLDVTYTYQTTDPETNTPVTATNTETFAFINPANQTTGIYANTDAYGTIHTIQVGSGLELYDSEDAFGKFASLRLKPDNRTIAIDNYSEIALAMGGIEFQGSIPSNTYRYAKVCTLTKTRKLTGGSANLNASFLVTYSGTDNTNPSLINISARIQGSTSSDATDAQKYGINKFNFTETRSNPTNKGITLYAQAYVTDNRQLVIDIYAKTSENWHGIKLTQLHAGGTYSIKYSDGTGAYDIKYYGPDSPNTAPLIETETEPEKPSNVYSSEDDFFRAKNCVNIDYFSLGTWDADDTALYMHVYYQSGIWRDYHGNTITDSTVKDRIYNMTTTYLDIGEKTSTPSALVLRSLDELGRASVKTILYSSTNYITSYENQIIRLQLPSENGATLATQSYAYRLYRNAYDLAATRRSASVSKVITEATGNYVPGQNPIYIWKETIKIGNKSGNTYDLNLRLATNLVVPNDPKTSYIALSRLDVLPDASKWGKLNSTTTFDVFGISHGYVIKTATQYNLPYTTTVLTNPSAENDNTICDRILSPSSLIDDDDPIIANPSYTELYIRAYNESLGGLMSVRLTLYLKCVSRKAGTSGGFNLQLSYAYDILDYPISDPLWY